ncbi:unnamed protein product [Chrysoparadoxa australica]
MRSLRPACYGAFLMLLRAAIGQMMPQGQPTPPAELPKALKLIASTATFVGEVGAQLAHEAVQHPKSAAAVTVVGATAIYLAWELPRSGIVIGSNPHKSLSQPSDKYLWLYLEMTRSGPDGISNNPEPGITKVLQEVELPVGEEEEEEAELRQEWTDKSDGWRQSVKRYRMGTGVGLYHKAAKDLMHLDMCDNLEKVEMVKQDTDLIEDGQEIVALLSKGLTSWALCPLELAYSQEDETVNSKHGGIKGRVTSVGLSTLKKSGYKGEWRFAVYMEEESEDVWYEAALFRKGNASLGKKHVQLLNRIMGSMSERSERDRLMIAARDRQKAKFDVLTKDARSKRKAKERDRILHPEKYERKHRWQYDSDEKGGGPNRPVRWGEARRASDIRLK